MAMRINGVIQQIETTGIIAASTNIIIMRVHLAMETRIVVVEVSELSKDEHVYPLIHVAFTETSNS
ncbi:hypothetical protein CHS0354_036263 [Potamilus streckersoni]|uniref:Uncharacterized protein n=1 Tax=Potamilus streckersoni TaxID=2493646 RepID=A0AAE0SVZ7_9BIVA|nr:hypothetical protein CHS0354_036263 [Potamilus streckersoni]